MKVTIEYDENFGVIELIEEFLKKTEFTHLQCGCACRCKGDGVWTSQRTSRRAAEVCERIYKIGHADFVKLEEKE